MALALPLVAAAGCGNGAAGSSPPGWSEWRAVNGVQLESGPSAGRGELTFLDGSHGWLLTGTRGALWSTSDGGVTWQREGGRIFAGSQEAFSEVPTRLTGLSAAEHLGSVGPATAWICEAGSRDALFLSTDAGRSWHARLQFETGEDIWAVSFADATHGWASVHVLEEVPGQKRTSLLRTRDGGKSWQKVSWESTATPGVNALTSLLFVDEAHGWAAGNSERAHGLVAQSADGGATWSGVPGEASGAVVSMAPVGTRELWVAYMLQGPSEFDKSYGWLQHTTNGGRTWEHVGGFDDSSLSGVCFQDSARGWVAGGDAVYGTVDGGSHWRKELSLPEDCRLESMACAADGVVAVVKDPQGRLTVYRSDPETASP